MGTCTISAVQVHIDLTQNLTSGCPETFFTGLQAKLMQPDETKLQGKGCSHVFQIRVVFLIF